MSELLARLKAGRAAVGQVTVDDVTFGLRLLTDQDYMAANIATEAAMADAGMAPLTVSTSEAYEQEKSSQLLVRALIDPATGKPVAATAQALREATYRDQQTHLINAYLAHEKLYSPSERTLTEDELAAVLEEVKKNPGTMLSSDLSSDTLKRLITALVSPPAN